MSEANKQLARQWFEEVWNKRRPEAIDELMAAEVRGYGLGNDPKAVIRSPADFKPWHAAFLDAFPDMRIEVEDALAEEDRVAVRCRVTGTHRGSGLGLAPTGQAVEFTGTVFLRIRDGRIVEGWNNFDFLGMFVQLGALQSPGLPR